MDRFDAMQIFVSVAELQSFAGAARRHALSAARVTRAVAALEGVVGARLLHRTTRAMRLTEAGASYLGHCKRILSEVEAAETGAASSHRELSGTFTVTAPVLFGRLHVTPIVDAFLKRHPRVTMRVLFADSVLDFFDHNIDVAIRIAPLPDSNLRAVPVGSLRRVVCASPAYLRARGTPGTPSELTKHDTIAFTGQVEHVWAFSSQGQHERVNVRPRLIVNTADLAVTAVRSGHGLTRVLSYQVAQEVALKRLKVVLSDYELPTVPVHIVRLEGREASTRVRAFADFAAPLLKAALLEVAAQLRPHA
jgi:DNA-binding transcriptional LysR family regulator